MLPCNGISNFAKTEESVLWKSLEPKEIKNSWFIHNWPVGLFSLFCPVGLRFEVHVVLGWADACECHWFWTARQNKPAEQEVPCLLGTLQWQIRYLTEMHFQHLYSRRSHTPPSSFMMLRGRLSLYIALTRGKSPSCPIGCASVKSIFSLLKGLDFYTHLTGINFRR